MLQMVESKGAQQRQSCIAVMLLYDGIEDLLTSYIEK